MIQVLPKQISFITIQILLILIVIITASAQNSPLIDSLKKNLSKPLTTEERLDTQVEIAFAYIREANTKEAKPLLQKALQQARKLPYLKAQIKINRGLGILEDEQGNYLDALNYHLKSLKIAQKLAIDEEVADSYKEVGIIYFNQGEYPDALHYFQQAQKLYEKTKQQMGVANILNNIGLIYHNLGEYDKSLQNYQKTLEIDRKLGGKRGIAYTLNNIAVVYEKQDQLAEARQYYEESLKIKQEIDDQQGIANTLSNIGIVHEKQKQYAIAEEYYLESLKINRTVGNKFRLTHILNALGEFHYKQKKFDKGRAYCQEALAIAEAIDSKYRVQIAAKSLMELEELAGNKAKAYDYALTYMAAKDTLFNEDKSREIGRLEAKYAFDKRAQALKLQQTKKEFQLNQKIQQQQYLLYGVALVAFFLIVIALIYYRYSTKLKQLNATKDKLFAIVAHDLKNPLSAFRAITQSLSENLNQISQKEIQYFLDKINTSSLQLYELLQNLLHWAINQTGQIEYKPQAIDIQMLSKQVIQQLEVNATLKSIQVTNQIQPTPTAFADPKMTSLTLRNLLSNAIKFTPKEGKITLQAIQKAQYLHIIVQDTGIGISKEDQAKLFRIDSDPKKVGSSPEKGTGLGLILCKELVEKQQGKIWVESQEGKGSRFIFSLPLSS